MRPFTRGLCFLPFLLFLLFVKTGDVSLLFAAGMNEQTEVLSDPRANWTLLLLEPSSSDTDYRVEALQTAFSDSITREIEAIGQHNFLFDEWDRYFAFLSEQERNSRREKIAKKERDIAEYQLQGERELEKKRIDERKKLEDALGNRISYDISFAKPIVVKTLPFQHISTSWIENEDADAVLVLEVNAVGEKYLYSMEFWAPFLGKERVYHSLVSGGSSVEAVAEVLIDRIRGSLVGRSWAALELTGKGDGEGGRKHPPLNLFLDGERLSPSATSNLLPGVYRLTVSSYGYETTEQIVFLAPNQRRHISVELKPQQSDLFTLRTEPEGASIYLDGKYVGISPLVTQSPTAPFLVGIVAQGYRDVQFPVEQNAGAYRFSLEPAGYDRQLLVDASRRRFYNAFGLFLLSIPVTMISYGIGSDYGIAANQAAESGSADQSEIDRLADKNRLWYTAYMGGLFLNVILGTNAIFSLADYIEMHESVYNVGRN
ncbi:PEGA domain-containing protein [Sediminispirochaeta smaragdinae]|uniref:PEGA domain protein n=1 Tax=Sediminispirochaeta smaragdinae (strain DSM 11293 / JCM 15392 / SEBR 4228) TaxID=573413 RepID=E1R6M8_SEDSS|nr:PEGA domain-containing protein [Sediminispirochaeta smaragdinae]ADK81046.1 PEGA domain protein [Sediminispirochaeta smaragdinae DSM 11293]